MGTIKSVKINSYNLRGDVSIELNVNGNKKHYFVELMNKEGKILFSYKGIVDTRTVVKFFINNPTLWSVINPYLYKYKVTVEDEVKEGNFGFRTLGRSEHNVLLNGSPIFIRGYIRGATAHEHKNLLGCSDKEYYRKNIKQAKKFGFNFVRFHSVVPSEDFFQVADEEGILVHLELRRPNDAYNNLEEMVNFTKNLVPDEFIRSTIDNLYNHPSLAVYCIGNEIKGLDATKRSDEIGKLVKKLDPNRLFLDTCAWGKLNRANIDMDVQHLSYYFPFGVHANMYSDARTFHILEKELSKLNLKEGENPYKIPLIAHEVCHYTALRDFKSLREKFASYNQEEPWWIEEELKLIHAKGFDEEYQEMFNASKFFQYECWKNAYEAIRRSPLLGGFHFLQFADTNTYENSNGVVDCFDDDTYAKSEDFLKFNGPVVLSMNLLKRCYTSNEILNLPVYLSNFSEKTLKTASLKVTVYDDGNLYKEETIEGLDVSKNGLSLLATYSLRTPTTNSSLVTINMELVNEEETITSNSWKLWVYSSKAMSYQSFVNHEDKDIVITDDIEKALSNLEKGKKVCLVYRSPWTRHLLDKKQKNPKYAFKATWNRFKAVILDRGTNFGGVVNDELLNKYGFRTSKYYDFNYSVISEDCDKIILDDFPIKVNSIISGNDKCNRDRFDAYANKFNLPELMYDRTLRRFSYMFELRVGKGSLLVTGLNLTGMDQDEPSSLRMKEFIFEYMNSSDFVPYNEISLEDFKNYLIKCAKQPVRERMMTQYWQLDNEPVESNEYWESSYQYCLENDRLLKKSN